MECSDRLQRVDGTGLMVVDVVVVDGGTVVVSAVLSHRLLLLILP